MYSDREVLCFLQHVPGIGSKTIRTLWTHFKTGEEIFNAPEKELECVLSEKQKNAFLKAREKENASERIAKIKATGIEFYSVFDWNYPRRLRKIADAPLALYVKGNLPPEDTMTASVIGARKHSYYGEKYARLFSGVLAEEGIEVVSGMAKGIDSIAQMAALECGGSSYAVLGCGVDVCYPEECRKLYDKLPLNGGIISEYPPGTMPNAGLFPLRNRIISALGDILLVMEARQRSGTLITVDMALEQGKEIWVLPGRCDDVLSYGCNRLITQGAGMLLGEQEFRDELELLKQKYERPILLQRGNKKAIQRMNVRTEQVESDVSQVLSEIEKIVLSVLDYQPLSLSGIYRKMPQEGVMAYSIQEVGNTLVELCMKGLAKQVGGSYYIRA